jgi:hypothetical protein
MPNMPSMPASLCRVIAGKPTMAACIDRLAYLRSSRGALKWLIAGLLAIVVAWPTSSWAQVGVSGRITILNVPSHGQFVRINLDAPTINPANCQAAEFYIVELSGPNANRFLSALYAAHASRASVSFWLNGCAAGQHWGATRPSVFDIYWHMQ